MPQNTITLTQVAELSDAYGPQLAFSPGGQIWAAVDGGLIHLWEDLQLLQTISLPGGAPGPIHFSADGRALFAGTAIIDLDRQQPQPLPPLAESLIAGLDPQTGPRPDQFEVNGASWSPDGSELVVYTQYRPLRRIDAGSGYSGPQHRLLHLNGRSRALIRVLWEETSHEELKTIAVSQRYIAAGGETIRVWERQSGRQVADLAGHSTAVRDLRFSPDGAHLASAGWDALVVVWDTARWQPLAQWTAHEDYAAVVAFHPQQPILATGGGDDQLKLWGLAADPPLLTSSTLDGYVEGAAFHPAGRRLVVAAGLDDEALFIFEVKV
jgi:WD40 repeat protein